MEAEISHTERPFQKPYSKDWWTETDLVAVHTSQKKITVLNGFGHLTLKKWTGMTGGCFHAHRRGFYLQVPLTSWRTGDLRTATWVWISLLKSRLCVNARCKVLGGVAVMRSLLPSPSPSERRLISALFIKLPQEARFLCWEKKQESQTVERTF